MKRVLTIQDMSCVGKCSLTVALPVLSAMGVEAVPLPTAVLSTHTAFQGAYVRDLTEIIEPVARHWEEQQLDFASIACGYLSSAGQMAQVKKIFETFRSEGSLLMIDPVMGDNGRLYSRFDMEFVRQMRELCRESDVFLPNLTEAAYLLDMEYAALPKTREGFESMARELAGLNNGIVILKGLRLREGRTGVLAYDAKRGRSSFCETEYLDAALSGTGDIFAAVCQGALTKGMSLESTVELAMNFVLECVKKTLADSTHRWYGVNFEEALPLLYGLGQDRA